MGIRSNNYLVLQPHVTLGPIPPDLLADALALDDERGRLFVFESNFTPMWARDGKGEHCTYDLEQEVALQRYLGTLPLEAFFLRRAGDSCDFRGRWTQHAFLDEPVVRQIEEAFTAQTA